MIGRRWHKHATWRGVFVTLAFFALLMKVAAPPGFMIAAPGSNAGFPLVICTGHGPLSQTPADSKGGERKTKSDAPCAFAGHAAPPTPSVRAEILASAFVQTPQRSPRRFDLTPGRGLAAPPPPAQGPPVLL
jgi:hypothetical protein